MKSAVIAISSTLIFVAAAAAVFHAQSVAWHKESAAERPAALPLPAKPIILPAPHVAITPAPDPAPAAPHAPVVTQASASASAPAGPARAPQDAAPAAITAPRARQALQTAGLDPDATQIWATAINDASINANLRKNLIEDLNQDGFPDTHNLTPADLPLLESRLALIEDMAPAAIDDINYAAFQEAYKDLLNMRTKIVGN